MLTVEAQTGIFQTFDHAPLIIETDLLPKKAVLNTPILADVHWSSLPKGEPVWVLTGTWPRSQVPSPLSSPGS